jgi:pyridoxamine 5'-phosphate oxidase
MVIFAELLERARAVEVFEATRAALATADESGRPSVRFVLVKGADHRGFVFFTDYRSRKSRELEVNPRGALAWHWSEIGAQVRAEGRVEKVSGEASDHYFASRPRGSQIGTWVSRQSAVLAARVDLEASYREAAERFGERPVPRPPTWGGFLLVPDKIEIWFNRDDRLHDRYVFERAGPEQPWRGALLYP